jgi:hypothetical protein
MIRADVDGDFGINGDETATYFDEDNLQLFQLGGNNQDCTPDTDSTTVAAAVFNTWNANSVVTFNVVLGSGVQGNVCIENFVSLTLTYTC